MKKGPKIELIQPGNTIDKKTGLTGGIPTFFHLPYVEPEPEALKRFQPDYALVGMPFLYEIFVRPGSNYGPRSVRLASEFVIPYNPRLDVDFNEALRVCDIGDLPYHSNPHKADLTFQDATNLLAMIYATGAKPIVVGGDHAAAVIPSGRAAAKSLQGQMGVLWFDHHLDNAPHVDDYELGDGSGLARLLDLPNINPRNCCHIGAGTDLSPKILMELARQQGFNLYPSWEIFERSMAAVIEDAIAKATDGTAGVYLTFDIDCLDGLWGQQGEVGASVGLTSREIMTAFWMVFKNCHIAGFDLSCVGPSVMPYGTPDAGARMEALLIQEYLCHEAAKKLGKIKNLPQGGR